MTIIYTATEGLHLIGTVLPKLTEDNVDSVRLHVTFDGTWNGYMAKRAVFTTSKSVRPYPVTLSSGGDCLVPPEVLAEECKLYIVIKGTHNSTGATKSSTRLTLKVQGGHPAVVISDPSPSVYQQLLTANAVLESRLSELEAAGTVDDAEVLGVRTGVDGQTYPTAGDAVRAQIAGVNVNDKVLKLVDFSGDEFDTTDDAVTKTNEVDTVSEDCVRRLAYTLSGTAGTTNHSEIVPASKVANVRRVLVFARSRIATKAAYVAVGSSFNWGNMDMAMLTHSDDFVRYVLTPVDTTKALNLYAGLKGVETKLDIEYYAVVEWKTSHYINADFAENALYAEQALRSGFANDAGYEKLAKLLTSAYNRRDHVVTKADDNSVRLTVPALSADAGTDAELWLYGIQAFKVTDLLGSKAVFRINITETNPGGDTIHIDRVLLNTSSSNWGTIIKRLDVRGEVQELELDLDALIADPSLYDDVYISVVYEVTLTPTSAGLFELKETNEINIEGYYTTASKRVVATALIGDPTYFSKKELKRLLSLEDIVCWGDSLTAQGGWTDRLAELSGMTVYVAASGGESVRTIMARQGADVMVVNNIVIPASREPVTVATAAEGGITTFLGYKVTPLHLGGDSHVNPVKIGNVEGTLKWTGNSYSDTSGTWTFTRSVAGDEVVIDRPTALTTAYDREKNSPYLMVIFMGQNGGYNSDNEELVNLHRLMIDHAKAKHVIVLGLSSGSASSSADYEAAMKKAFGRYFISLREYLSQYGLADAGLTPTVADTTAMMGGTVPPQLLADDVHYTDATKTVIGNLIYKRCCELGIFEA